MEPTKEQKENWHNNPNNWKLGIHYYNTEDPRAMVAKRIKWMGWAINFANPKSVLLFVVISALRF